MSPDLPTLLKAADINNKRLLIRLRVIIILATTATVVIVSRHQAGDSPMPVIAGCLSVVILLALDVLIKDGHRSWVLDNILALDLDLDDAEADIDVIIQAILEMSGSPLAKEYDETSGAARYRTRGVDEKGPDWGRSDGALDEIMPIRDAIAHGDVFAGLEGPLTTGEMIRREADLNAAEVAQERWQRAEESDPELIEAGVDRLGDMVPTGHFERTNDEGGFARLTDSTDSCEEEV